MVHDIPAGADSQVGPWPAKDASGSLSAASIPWTIHVLPFISAWHLR